MKSNHQTTKAGMLHILSILFAASTATIGLLVLAGWQFNVALLKSLHPEFVSMKANTALAFVFAGVALLLLQDKGCSRLKYNLAVILSSGVALIGVLTLFQYLFVMDLGIDEFLFKDGTHEVATFSPGRMAMNTAMGFVLLGAALLLLLIGGHWQIRASQSISLLLILLSLIPMLGYAYRAPELYGFAVFTQMALHTALAFVLISSGVLLARPAKGFLSALGSNSLGGFMARRIIPLALIIPVFLVVLRLTIEVSRLGGLGVETIFFSVALILLFMFLAWRFLESINMLDGVQKEKEEELQHSQRLLKFAGKLAQLGGWSVNLNENRVIWSDEVAAIHEMPSGYSPTVEEGINFYAPEFQDRIKEVYNACAAEGIPYDEELQIITGKGNRVWVRTIGVAERDHDGNIYRVHGGFQNINERKEAEKIRQTQYNIARSFVTGQSVEQLLDVIQDELARVIDADHFSVAFHDLGKDGFFNLFNDDQGRQRISSLIKQKPITDLVLKRKQSVILTKEDLLDLIGNTDSVNEIHLPEVWLGVPMILNEGVMGIMVFENHENTEAFENTDFQMLEILAGELSIYIQKKHNEEALVLAKEKAEESERLKSAFLTNISHEIRTPMNAILGFLELLRNPDLADDEQQEYIAIVNKSAQRLLTTINDLVELSKLEAGQAEVNFQEVDVWELLQTQYALFKPQADEKGLLLNLDNRGAGDFVTICDRHKLQAVLVNLINNAIKFTPKGRINFGCSANDEMLVFYVKDTGVGIPEGKQEVIFKRFVQADPDITRGYEGSGLGLSIADAYIRLMGGKIWVESEVDLGSTFYFSIPLKKSDREKKKEVTPATSGVDLKGHCILVAEDDDMSYLYLEAVLEEHVEEMVRAKTGEEVIDMLKENPDVSIILMDLKMPGMGGLQATREIRKFNQTIPIIAQTAHALEGDKNIALEAGCSDYITKPIKYEALMNVICANLNA